MPLSADDLDQEASQGKRADFDRWMAAVPDAPPLPGDEWPAPPEPHQASSLAR